MKTIYCDSNDSWCKEEYVSDNFEEACKELNKRGWKKIGIGQYWKWYCESCSQIICKKLGI